MLEPAERLGLERDEVLALSAVEVQRRAWEVSEWLALAGGLALLCLPGTSWLPAAVALLLVSFGLRSWRVRRLLPHTGLEIPWLLFLFSAGIAAWISIAPPLAWLQWSRILAAFVLFYAVVDADRRLLRPPSGRAPSGRSPSGRALWASLAWLILAGSALLAISFSLTHPFAGDPGKFSVITAVGRAINLNFPGLVREWVSANVTGGMLALATPFGVALVWSAWQEKRRVQAVTAILLTLLTLVGLTLTSSRGAILGLVAAAGLALLGWVQVRWLPRSPGKALFWLGIGFIALGSLAGLALSGSLERLAGAVPDPNGSLQSRMSIWRQSIPLVGDYVFSGAGLSTFPIVFSIYRLLIHVPYHEHMHNIFLEAWFEQGMLGALALAWGALVVAGWAWRALSPLKEGATHSASDLRPLGFAGLAALAAMGLHGMVDVVFYLKASMPLVGLVAGMAWYANPPAASAVEVNRRTGRILAGALAGGAALLIFTVLFGRQALAAGYANLGALAQTRAEMSVYNPDRFDAPLLDDIRRTADISLAEAALQQALALDPTQRTALQRLAGIELSRGQPAAALARMQVIQARPWLCPRGSRAADGVTNLLLSDALAAEGELTAAAAAAAGAPWAAGRLLFQGWYRYWLVGDYRGAANAWETALLLDPGNADARYLLEQARAQGELK